MSADSSLHGAPSAGLFDVERVVHTRHDVRSVGEMLHDADHLARGLLMDVDGPDAAALLRTWPTVVDAGASVWEALPPVHGKEHVLAMERLAATAGLFGPQLDTAGGWPGRGPGHAGAEQIVDTLRSAGSLIARFGGETRPEKAEVRRDLDATRARVMHTLYLTAHACSVALHAHGRDLVRDSHTREGGRPITLSLVHSAYAVPPTVAWHQRVSRCEGIAGDYLAGRFATSVQGEASSPLGEPGRVPSALARWDIQAHRSLAADPSPANLGVTARTQAWIAAATGVLLSAATPGAPQPDRLASAIASAGATWSDLASRWHDLANPSDQIDPHLLRAAAEVRAACRELTHTAAVLASPETIASRPGVDLAVSASLEALTAAGELAYTVEAQALVEGLAGPARALSQRAHNDVEAGLFTLDPRTDNVWISPADIHAKRTVPLPPPVVHGLRTACKATVFAATDASMAATIQRSPEVQEPRLRRCDSPRVTERSSGIQPSVTRVHR